MHCVVHIGSEPVRSAELSPALSWSLCSPLSFTSIQRRVGKRRNRAQKVAALVWRVVATLSKKLALFRAHTP